MFSITGPQARSNRRDIMDVFLGVVGGAGVGFVAGVIVSGRAQAAIEHLEKTLVAKLKAIETAVKKKI
jgi:hypothetical protein